MSQKEEALTFQNQEVVITGRKITSKCANCNTKLGENTNYCSNCGAKIIVNRLTGKHLFSEFSERFLNLDNNLLARTFTALFKKPEIVIDGYINGVRKKYASVVNYLALAITITGLQLFIIKKFFPASYEIAPWMKQNNANLQQGFMDSFFEYQGVFYLLIIPVLAFVSYLVFYNIKKYNYVENIVILGYTQAQMSLTVFLPFIVFSALGFNLYNFSFINTLFSIAYSAYCFKRIYKLSLKRLLVKTLIFIGIGLIVYIILIIIVSIIMGIYMYLNGDMQQLINAEKAKQGLSYIASSIINWTS